ELLPNESPAACVAFLRRAHNWYADRGITIERVLSDNGNGYRSLAWRDACPRAPHPAPLHTLAAAADQRESRSARQDTAARMGLPPRLPLERPPRPRAPQLPALVQPPPTAQLPRRPPTHQPRLTGPWVSQLDGLHHHGAGVAHSWLNRGDDPFGRRADVVRDVEVELRHAAVDAERAADARRLAVAPEQQEVVRVCVRLLGQSAHGH